MSEFEVLGNVVAAEAVGEDGGLNAQFGINAASELLSRGVATYEKKKADDEAKRNDETKLQNAIAADVAWANAETMLNLAQPAQKPSAQVVAQSAMSTALAAGSGLSDASAQKRLASAQKAASDAAKSSYADSKSQAKSAAMKSWQKIAATLASGGGSSSSSSKSLVPSMANLHKGLGNIPTWGWVAGGVVVAGGLYLIVRAMRKR